MDQGPVSGKNGIQISLPQGKTCFWAAFTQAAFTLRLHIVDENGKEIVNETGSGINFNLLGAGKFDITTSTYTVYITVNNGQDVQVLWGEKQLTVNNQVYSSTLTFIGEDYVDEDYNDIFASLNWFEYSK